MQSCAGFGQVGAEPGRKAARSETCIGTGYTPILWILSAPFWALAKLKNVRFEKIKTIWCSFYGGMEKQTKICKTFSGHKVAIGAAWIVFG
eukprot:scaffold613_cov243-Pinguiococcus_pyrenoidosus.AAC.38